MKSQNQSSNILTRKWKQFTCLHRWKKGDIVDMVYGKGYKYAYECTECGKKIARWYGNEPISGLLPKDAWEEYKKDPYNNMSPPIFRIDD